MRLGAVTILSFSAALAPSTKAAPAGDNTEHKLNTVRTTAHNGIIVDWITRESQGRTYTPPSRPPSGARPRVPGAHQVKIRREFQGPTGSVPIARINEEIPMKQLPPCPSTDGLNATKIQARAGAAGKHWYASSSQRSRNHGGGAFISTHKPFIERQRDFSLLQIAVIHDAADQPNGAARRRQTVEAGWQYYPPFHKDGPLLFTFFSTDGHQSQTDLVGGYNTKVKGWYQHDKDIHPGMPLSQFSVDGGDQQEIEIMFMLSEECWWLYTLDRYIGCYPTSLFHPKGVDARKTLAAGATSVSLYGEIFNSGEQVTTTDMGSGHPAGEGWQHAAYMRKMTWLDVDGNTTHHWDGTSEVDDPARYSIDAKFKSGIKDWDSFMFLGGPGAGGRIGG